MAQIVENSSLLCSCFIILENSVVFICQQSDLAETNTGTQNTSTLILNFFFSFSLSLSLSLCLRMLT